MIDKLQDILLNIFIMISPSLLIHVFSSTKEISQRMRKWNFIIFGSIQIIFCIMFPIFVIPGHRFDFGQFPIIMGFFYGGNYIGFLLFFIYTFFRYTFGGNGFLVSLITNGILAVLLFILNKKERSDREKLISSIILSFFRSLIILIIFATPLYSWNPEILSVSFIVFVIQTIVFLIAFSIIMAMRNAIILREKAVKNEKYEIVSHLAASISHEVRNPLTVSKGFIQMLRSSVHGKEREYVKLALSEMERAQEIINNYLTFAKPDLREIKIINIKDTMEKIIRIIEPLANMNNTAIELFVKNNFRFRGDESKLTQSLINILKNAMEASSNGGHIRIHIYHVNHQGIIDIKDKGIGMTKEQLKRLGEPYFTTKGNGTGLGTMVAFRIIYEMKGTIDVTSKEGLGTEVKISFPILTEITAS